MTPQLWLDSKTQARILKLASPTHLQALFERRQDKEYGKTLNALLEYLFALGVMVGWRFFFRWLGNGVAGLGKSNDKDKPPAGRVVQFLAGGGGAGFVSELWRGGVRDDNNDRHCPPLPVLMDVYAQTTITLVNDEIIRILSWSTSSVKGLSRPQASHFIRSGYFLSADTTLHRRPLPDLVRNRI
ncbi:hypothetical protein BJ165DRAFT_1404911 [Panaeolus papilionaceus]|nr:hypothetical protein BJ165DRAFT_1404911 [Panaeolus papilionaceus]